MPRTIIQLSVFALASLLGTKFEVSPAGPPQTSAATGVVVGVVVDQASGKPIEAGTAGAENAAYAASPPC